MEENDRYYFSIDEDGYLLSVAVLPEGTGSGPSAESVEGLDLSGRRIGAYRWDGAALVFDAARYAVLAAEDAEESAGEQIMELTARLRRTDSVVLEALENLFSATTLTGFLAALIESARGIRETLTERADIRARIAELKGDIT